MIEILKIMSNCLPSIQYYKTFTLDFLKFHLYVLIVQLKMGILMNKIAVSELRSNLMKVLKQIEGGSEITITSRGKIVAKLVPPDFEKEDAQKKLKDLRKKAVIGDLISPIDEKWKAMN